MKNSLEGSNKRRELAKEMINQLEDKTTEIVPSRMKGNERIVRDAWDLIKYTNIHIMGFLEEKEEGEKRKGKRVRTREVVTGERGRGGGVGGEGHFTEGNGDIPKTSLAHTIWYLGRWHLAHYIISFTLFNPI